jgi:hypothetical protein
MAPARMHAPQQASRSQAGSRDGCMAQELWHLPVCACRWPAWTVGRMLCQQQQQGSAK